MSVTQPPVNSPEIRRLDPVLAPGHTYASVTDKIAAVVLTRPLGIGWLAGFTSGLHRCDGPVHLARLADHQGRRDLGHQHSDRLGICDRQFRLVDRYRPRRHADLRHSVLLNQKWRTSINRFAEAMTLFAVACAGIFPLIHTGRPWMAYYMFPYPSTMGIWPQFRSPLIWDVFAVSTYGTVSLLFWFVGLLPDLATLRDRAKNRTQQVIYGVLSMGWREFRASLAPLPVRLSPARRPCNASGAFRAHRRELRFLRGHCPRLAHHHFPALLRRRRHLFGICDGFNHLRFPCVRPTGWKISSPCATSTIWRR